jgi:hypothetical protein
VSDWPIIQGRPGPTDAELQVERDRQHAVEVERWMARCECPALMCHCDWPIGKVEG